MQTSTVLRQKSTEAASHDVDYGCKINLNFRLIKSYKKKKLLLIINYDHEKQQQQQKTMPNIF